MGAFSPPKTSSGGLLGCFPAKARAWLEGSKYPKTWLIKPKLPKTEHHEPVPLYTSLVFEGPRLSPWSVLFVHFLFISLRLCREAFAKLSGDGKHTVQVALWKLPVGARVNWGIRIKAHSVLDLTPLFTGALPLDNRKRRHTSRSSGWLQQGGCAQEAPGGHPAEMSSCHLYPIEMSSRLFHLVEMNRVLVSLRTYPSIHHWDPLVSWMSNRLFCYIDKYKLWLLTFTCKNNGNHSYLLLNPTWANGKKWYCVYRRTTIMNFVLKPLSSWCLHFL